MIETKSWDFWRSISPRDHQDQITWSTRHEFGMEIFLKNQLTWLHNTSLGLNFHMEITCCHSSCDHSLKWNRTIHSLFFRKSGQKHLNSVRSCICSIVFRVENVRFLERSPVTIVILVDLGIPGPSRWLTVEIQPWTISNGEFFDTRKISQISILTV